jgi:hypothetical protein
MLVEVPKSQDTGESLTETIGVFVDQLKTVQEIGRLLDQLHRAMHFDFQSHNESFSSQTPLPILQARAEKLAAMLKVRCGGCANATGWINFLLGMARNNYGITC